MGVEQLADKPLSKEETLAAVGFVTPVSQKQMPCRRSRSRCNMHDSVLKSRLALLRTMRGGWVMGPSRLGSGACGKAHV